MLRVGPGWSWDVGGGQRDKKEGASGPRLDQLSIKVGKKNVLLILWILEELHVIDILHYEILHFNLC